MAQQAKGRVRPVATAAARRAFRVARPARQDRREPTGANRLRTKPAGLRWAPEGVRSTTGDTAMDSAMGLILFAWIVIAPTIGLVLLRS